jgi:hypothetical protein
MAQQFRNVFQVIGTVRRIEVKSGKSKRTGKDYSMTIVDVATLGSSFEFTVDAKQAAGIGEGQTVDVRGVLETRGYQLAAKVHSIAPVADEEPKRNGTAAAAAAR